MHKFVLMALLFISYICNYANTSPVSDAILTKNLSGEKEQPSLQATLKHIKKFAYFACLTYSEVDDVNDNHCLNDIYTKPLAEIDTWFKSSKERFIVSKPLPTGEIVFAFRGDVTKRWKKVLNSGRLINGKLISMQYASHDVIPVNEYAFEKYKIMRKTVLRLIQDFLMKNKTQKFFFIGHSMGGPIAYFAALEAHSFGIPGDQIEVITFNAVRAGGKELNSKLQLAGIKSTRVVEDKDPLTFLPVKAAFEYQPGWIQINNGALKDCAKEHCQVNEEFEKARKESLSSFWKKLFSVAEFPQHYRFLGRDNYFQKHNKITHKKKKSQFF